MFRISLPWIALWALLSASDLVHGTSLQSSSKQLHARQAVHRPNPLRNFEVREPPSVPKSQPCEVAIVEHRRRTDSSVVVPPDFRHFVGKARKC
ncbi:hypothetical protein PGT21_009100 [Puccinia graminis f. sp. tritici]|uniref:Secreted protein n=1 Tax=Puccinia graminis f. sp. tritici TaxID=56615 RepID=A0A5B0MWM9_PUCGR|nr:hypothetical protein PGT21_009100 [Puccinia graminis f. sp. tritici]